MTKRDRYAQRLEPGADQDQMPGQEEIYFNTPSPIPDRVSKNAALQTENLELKTQLEQLQAMMGEQPNSLTMQDGALMVQGFQFTPTGLVAPEGMTQVSWEQIGFLLFRLEGSIQWLIGDWLAYGMDLQYGDMPALAENFGRDPQTLRSYKQMAENIQYARRRADLSFAHHLEVRTLSTDQQDYALAHAAAERLNRAAFRNWIREQKGEVEQPRLPAGDMPDLNAFTRDVQKFMQADPAALKPKQFHAAQTQVQIRLRELDQIAATLRQRWGLDE